MLCSRRSFLAAMGAVPVSISAMVAGAVSDPWPETDLIRAAKLADMLRSGHDVPVVIDVGFPVLYRQRHIGQSVLGGPASKPEGISQLKQTVAHVSKDAAIVIYCGCCPMAQCPNVRPAYRALKDLGHTRVFVLDLPNNLRTDWTEKGYPVEPPVRS